MLRYRHVRIDYWGKGSAVRISGMWEDFWLRGIKVGRIGNACLCSAFLKEEIEHEDVVYFFEVVSAMLCGKW